MERPQILVVAPDSTRARRVEHVLSEGLAQYRVSRLGRLDEAEVWLDWNVADAIVLDLDLPDAGGSEVVARLRAACETAPILLLVGAGSAAEAAAACQAAGADDWLRAEDLQLSDLARIAHYGLAHARDARLQELERAVATYRMLAAPCALRGRSEAPMRTRDAAAYTAIAERYTDLLHDYLTYVAAAGSRPQSSIDAMVDRIVAAGAAAADLIEIHTSCVDELARGRTAERAQALLVEGRVLALDLMAGLADAYRFRAGPIRAAGDRPLSG